jgi:DNA polymerase III alpha subunit (gram-positive type)
MSNLIAFDCETGGISDETSLLTVYFAILDYKLKQIDELSLALKPNDGKPYIVEPEGLHINKINLFEHDKIAVPYSSGGQQLFNLLKKYNMLDKNKITPLGHNVHFDIGGVNRNLLGAKTWNQFVSYKCEDTQIVARHYQRKGILPVDMSISLGSLIKFFNVNIPGNQHEAKYDTLATVEVYKSLLRL